MNPSHIRNIVIKLGRARRVDPRAGPVRVCQKTGQCNDPVKPGRPGGSTRDPGETQPRPGFFFFQMGDLKPIVIYIYSIFPRKKLCFFNVG